ncbi:MurR/RpiR family transcriptional regulator [Lactobacillus sp. CBA3606]|uniref:MurR/RpiR family transcriptional regulator n=1 Tax=Lactobacillus sp. CBA3606 TaxID=2099789 RepID=UPI000CFC85DB|nr:MurR/RpiR family transcriptional regulator [Lactobacillus sp. CBA3606]AVK63023.1 MurR/RpiR family transcriptional regulator [Lactobacillus sp. CBA3606]
MTNILFTIHSRLADFSKADQKIGRYILKHAHAVITMSTAELATAAGVSTATVVRFGKAIIPDGGYPALKLKLSAETNVDQKLYAEINPQDSLTAVKSKLALRVSHTIEETNVVLENAALKKASQLLAQAQNIYVFGIGASDVVASDFQQKFMRVGKSVMHAADGHLVAVGLTTQKAHAVLVLVSNSGEKAEGQQLAELAKTVAVPIIVLTRNAKSPLGQLADVVLLNDDSEENQTARSAATTSLLAQLYVVDLLYYTYIKADYQTHIQQLIESRDAIQEHF